MFCVQTVDIHVYSPRREHFLKMNNHRRKGHRCAEVVHYGSGIIAFLTLVPIVMKRRRRPTLSDGLRRGSITRVWVWGSAAAMPEEKRGGGSDGFVEKCVAPKSPHKSLYHFQPF